ALLGGGRQMDLTKFRHTLWDILTRRQCQDKKMREGEDESEAYRWAAVIESLR
ncbi:glucosidase 2 subunit beta, partial [Lates japonicus]